MTQEKVNDARKSHLKDELDYKRASNYAAVLDIEERTKINAHRDRGILIQWIDKLERDRAELIAKYENKISQLEIEIEETSAPKFNTCAVCSGML